MAMLMGKNFVAEALAEIMKLKQAVDAYIALDGNRRQHRALQRLADPRSVERRTPRTDINSIFGTTEDPDTDAGTFTDPNPVVRLRTLDANDDAEDAVEAFDALITALSGGDAFAAATEEDGDGVLEKAALSADDGHGCLRSGNEHVGGGPGDDREHALRCLLAAGGGTLRPTISSMSTRTKTRILTRATMSTTTKRWTTWARSACSPTA